MKSTVKDSFTVAKGWRKRGAGRIKLMNTTQTQVRSTEEALKLALDKKAENARDLGLDYEPENTLHWHALNYRTAPTQNAQKMFEALEKFVENAVEKALAQQNPQGVSNEQVEPVAWLDKYGEIHKDLVEVLPTDRPLYTHPPVPYVVEPRTAQSKPLTDEQIDVAIKCAKKVDTGYAGWVRDQRREFARAIEAAHGIYAPSERRPSDFKE